MLSIAEPPGTPDVSSSTEATTVGSPDHRAGDPAHVAGAPAPQAADGVPGRVPFLTSCATSSPPSRS